MYVDVLRFVFFAVRFSCNTHLPDLEVGLPVQGFCLHVRDAGGRRWHRLVDPDDENIARYRFSVVDHDQIPYLDLFKKKKKNRNRTGWPVD